MVERKKLMSVARLPTDRPITSRGFPGQAAGLKRRFRDAEPVRASLIRQRILNSFCQTEPVVSIKIYFSQ
jgi:hypothetical protein